MTKKIDHTFTRKLIQWYRENRRDLPWRKDKDPYHVWVSEIMLQQTRVEAVREYYLRFMKRLPSVADLAAASEETLLKLWQGLGYYNRIRNMHKAARTVTEELGGIFPQTYEEIKKLSGIGEYTAGAIASICFDRQVAAVDGNVLRVMSRLRNDDSDILNPGVKKQVGAYLSALYPEENCGDFTQGLIELGALICGPSGPPKCDICPVAEYCLGRELKTAVNLPVKAAKKERKKVKITVFVLEYKEKGRQTEQEGGKEFLRLRAVSKRPETGLLAGLYQFPNEEGEMTASEAVSLAEEWGVKPLNLLRRTEYTHVFTHVEWEMTGYYLEAGKMCPQFQWVSDEEMERDVPMPTAFSYFLK